MWWEGEASARGSSPCRASAGCGHYSAAFVHVYGKLKPGTRALPVGFSSREGRLGLLAEGLLCHWEA